MNKQGDSNFEGDLAMAKVLTQLTNSVANTSSALNVTTFEMSKLLDEPHSFLARSPQVNLYMGELFQCITTDQVETYSCAWRSYVYQEKRSVGDHFLNQLVSQPPCSNDEIIDEILSISGCCDMSKPLRQEHELIMKVMKYTTQAPHFRQRKEEQEMDFMDAPAILPYKLKQLDSDSTFWNVNPRIHTCQYDQEPSETNMPSCYYFVRSYTNEGFGYTFNNRFFWNKHKTDNPHNQRFYYHMHPVQGNGQPDMHYPTSSGSHNGLSLVLQLNKYEEAVQ